MTWEVKSLHGLGSLGSRPEMGVVAWLGCDKLQGLVTGGFGITGGIGHLVSRLDSGYPMAFGVATWI